MKAIMLASVCAAPLAIGVTAPASADINILTGPVSIANTDLLIPPMTYGETLQINFQFDTPPTGANAMLINGVSGTSSNFLYTEAKLYVGGVLVGQQVDGPSSFSYFTSIDLPGDIFGGQGTDLSGLFSGEVSTLDYTPIFSPGESAIYYQISTFFASLDTGSTIMGDYGDPEILSVNILSVPEPASLAFFTVGILGVGLSRHARAAARCQGWLDR